MVEGLDQETWTSVDVAAMSTRVPSREVGAVHRSPGPDPQPETSINFEKEVLSLSSSAGELAQDERVGEALREREASDLN